MCNLLPSELSKFFDLEIPVSILVKKLAVGLVSLVSTNITLNNCDLNAVIT